MVLFYSITKTLFSDIIGVRHLLLANLVWATCFLGSYFKNLTTVSASYG